MTYVLIIMSSIAIIGFESEAGCMDARAKVNAQLGRNLDAGAVCVPIPKDGDIVVVGRRTVPQ
jgi:hypothetical protein